MDKEKEIKKKKTKFLKAALSFLYVSNMIIIYVIALTQFVKLGDRSHQI